MKSKLLTIKRADMKKSLLIGVFCFLATFAACSGRQIMKDCQALGQVFWQCEKP